MNKASENGRLGLHLHRIKPILLGGSPTDPKNIHWVTRLQHAQLCVFWNNIVKDAKTTK